MDSTLSSEVVGECNDKQEMPQANGVNRKRRLSQTPSDADETPPQKKTTKCDVPETGESAAELKNGNVHSELNQDEDKDLDVFSLEHFCDEILYEIFKYLDTRTLMTFMNVSKRFEKFVLDKRFWEKIDLSQEPLPLGILEDILERSHEKTVSIKLMGPSTLQHIALETSHFTKTLRNSLTTRCTRLNIIELFSVTLDLNQFSFKDFPASLKRLVLINCNVLIRDNRSLFTGIETVLVNLEELAIETNDWFDPYYIMPIAKLPSLKYLSFKGCSQMAEFIPYGSIAGRHGFKTLEVLDLRETPLNDSDLQCFNTIDTLKEVYLQCPKEVVKALEKTPPNNDASTTAENDEEQPSTSSRIKIKVFNKSSAQHKTSSTSSSAGDDNPSTSAVPSKDFKVNLETPSEADSESPTSPETAEVSAENVLSQNATCDVPDAAGNDQPSSPPTSNAPRNQISLSNAPSRNRILPRPDRVIYLDCRNRIPNHPFHVNYLNRDPRLRFQAHAARRQQRSPPPPFEQMVHHNLFWNIINPLGRPGAGGGLDRIFGEENEADNGHVSPSPLGFLNTRPRGSISDRGVCCFGRAREPVQLGVIWIRFNNRPLENRFERFIVRDYKSVTDTSLEHLVQCSPNLVFLDVSGTSVTMRGIRAFKEVKPECVVLAEHLSTQDL